jgi:hypothetical protein
MAASLQEVTTFGDEAILAGQEMLLTFTAIGEETFPRATETMLDMATVFKTDAKNAAIQLGKALNDPILGITALSRVGVRFTEQQKAQIKAMMDVNDVAGAQKIILDELAVETGGAARAAAETLSGKMKQLKNSFGDASEELGKRLQPALMNLVDYMQNDFKPILEGVMNSVGHSINTVINDVVEGLRSMTAQTEDELDKQKESHYGVGWVIELVWNGMQNVVIGASNIILLGAKNLASGIMFYMRQILLGYNTVTQKIYDISSTIAPNSAITKGLNNMLMANLDTLNKVLTVEERLGKIQAAEYRPMRSYAEYVKAVDVETGNATKSTNKLANALNGAQSATDGATEAAKKEAAQLKENMKILDAVGDAIKNSLINNIENAYVARESLFDNYSKGLEEHKNQQINDETFLYNVRKTFAEDEYEAKRLSLENQITAREAQKDAEIQAIEEEKRAFESYIDLQLSRIDQMEINRMNMIDTAMNEELGAYDAQIAKINELIDLENDRYNEKQREKTLQNLKDQIDLEDNLYRKQQLINQYNETVANYQRQDKIKAWKEEQQAIKDKIDLTKEAAKEEQNTWAENFDAMREREKEKIPFAEARFDQRTEDVMKNFGFDTNELNIQIEELDKTFEQSFEDMEKQFTNRIATIEQAHEVSINLLTSELEEYRQLKDELLNEESLTSMIVKLFTSGDYVRYINENIPKIKTASKSIGEAIVDGVGLGLESQTVINQFAEEILFNLKKDLLIASPSKKTEPIGEDTGAGFVKGMYNTIPDAIAAGGTLSDAALGAMAAKVPQAGGGKAGMGDWAPDFTSPYGYTSSGEAYNMIDMFNMSPMLRNSPYNRATTAAMLEGKIDATGDIKRYIDTWVNPTLETAPEYFSPGQRQAQADRVGYHPSSYQVTNNVYTQTIDQPTMNKITESTTTQVAMETSV